MGKYVRHVGVTTAGVTSSMLTLLTCPRPHGRLLVTKLLRSGDRLHPFLPAAHSSGLRTQLIWKTTSLLIPCVTNQI